jgi:GT2 family glycosyltransferase
MAADQPELSIVVMFTHDAEQAKRCLQGVAIVASEVRSSETIIVLNQASEEVRREVSERAPKAQVIDSPANTGTAVAWQLAFTLASGKFVFLMHEDAVATHGMAPRLIETLSGEPGAAAVGPWLSEQAGDEPTNAGWLRFRDASDLRLRPDQLPAGLADAPYATDEISSAISLWDRAAWLEIGGFDERTYPAISVEAASFEAFWSCGRSVLVDPRARGIHRSGAMNSSPGLLSGPHVRHFLFTRFQRFWDQNWAGRADWLIETDDPGGAIDEALARAQVRRKSLPKLAEPPAASHLITNPDGADPPPTTVDEAMAERIRAAERIVIDDYTRWLIARDVEMSARYDELHDAYVALGDRVEDLEDRSSTLEAIYAGRWWRLRVQLRRLIGR